MDDSVLFILIPLVFIPFFILFWSAIVFFISFASGWSQLKQIYRTDMPFTGELSRFLSGRLRRATYSGVLVIGRNGEGLYLRPLMPYRPGHPPLFIPWDEIEMSEGKVLFSTYTEMIFSQAPHITFRLFNRSSAWLLEKKDY